jgi:putative peptidoglycan lipid II flippase
MKNRIKRFLALPILQKQTVLQATVIIAILNNLTKVIGFSREMLIAKYFGTSGILDAYLIGIQVPTLVLGLFGGGIGTLIVPMYIIHKKRDPQDSKRYVNQIVVVCCIIFLLISILSAIFAPFLIKIVAYGFSGKKLALAIYITRLLSVYGFVNILNTLFSALLQAEKQFIIQNIFMSIFNAINVLIILYLSKYYGIYSLVIGTYFIFTCSLLINLYLLIKKYKFFNFNLFYIKWIEIKEFFMLLMPTIFSSGVTTINAIADNAVASNLSNGSIAAIQFSQKIWTLPTSLFLGSIAVTIFPSFSELATDKLNINDYIKNINRTIIALMFFFIPSSVFLILFSQPITKLFYQRGAFNAQATQLTSFVNQMFCLGIMFMALLPLLLRVFYTLKNTIIPFIITIFTVSLNIIGNIVLSKYLFAGGIALSTTIAHLFGYIAAYYLLMKYFKANYKSLFKNKDDLIKEFIKDILSAIPMVVVGVLFLGWFNINTTFLLQVFKLVLVVGILSIVFFYTSLLFKSKGSLIYKIIIIREITRLRLLLCKTYSNK